MGNIQYDVFPPLYWQEFERLTKDIYKLKWKDDSAQMHGRVGQSQSGVDVYGYDYVNKKYVGIQCKRKNQIGSDGIFLTSPILGEKEILDEIEKAKKFDPSIDIFILATTASRDVGLQKVIRTINQNTNKKPFEIQIKFWDDFAEYISNNESLMYSYYENVLKSRNAYNNNTHYLNMLKMAFDRPAFKTRFHLNIIVRQSHDSDIAEPHLA